MSRKRACDVNQPFSPDRARAFRCSGKRASRQGRFPRRKRIFATLGHPDENWGTLKLTAEQQSILVAAEPEIFRPVPGGWGKQGYTNVLLAKADATTLKGALTIAWENVAPRTAAKSGKKASR